MLAHAEGAWRISAWRWASFVLVCPAEATGAFSSSLAYCCNVAWIYSKFSCSHHDCGKDSFFLTRIRIKHCHLPAPAHGALSDTAFRTAGSFSAVCDRGLVFMTACWAKPPNTNFRVGLDLVRSKISVLCRVPLFCNRWVFLGQGSLDLVPPFPSFLLDDNPLLQLWKPQKWDIIRTNEGSDTCL